LEQECIEALALKLADFYRNAHRVFMRRRHWSVLHAQRGNAVRHAVSRRSAKAAGTSS
jgi:hypothetical protein